MKKNILIFLVLISYKLSAQNCDCNRYFEWTKSTIEENDAGAKYAIESKGVEIYKLYNDYFQEKAINTSDINDCVLLLSKWLSFFRKGHIGIYLNHQQELQSDQQIRFVFKKKTSKEIDKIGKDLLRHDIHNLEYFWGISDYSIVIKKDKDHYIGFLNSDYDENWKKGDVKFYFDKDLKNGVYIFGDRSTKKIQKIEYLENKFLLFDDLVITKKDDRIKLSNETDLKYKIRFEENPFIYQLNDETIYIKLPSFSQEYKNQVDSLVLVWDIRLRKAQDLIIDVRNNGGGADKTYHSLLPYIATNNIYRNQIEYLSSKLNNEEWENILKLPDLPEFDRNLISDFVNRVNRNIGGFEKLFLEENYLGVTFLPFENIFTHPKNIAILMNKNTGSAAEQFIQDVRQSWKVKLFGQQTAGALDVANVKSIISQDNLLTLVYSTSRYVTYNKLKIDETGILPDFYINENINEDEWIKFVLERMK
jgi:hypothetical protein